MSFSLKKKHSPSNPAPPNGLAPQSQANQQLQFPNKSQSQSDSQSSHQTLQSQPLYPWSAHTPSSGHWQWPSPFPRHLHALSTTATATGELLLFGGKTHSHLRNDLYMISTRDFSTTLLQTSGDVPNPRFLHCSVLTSTALLIWGGRTDFSVLDDSFYLLDLVSREWTRIVVSGSGPGGRYYHTMTLVGSKLFVFGGKSAKWYFNDIWALDLNCLEANPFWESYEPAPGNEKPLPRLGHVSVTTGDRIIIFGGFSHLSPHFRYFNDTWSFNISTRKWTEIQCTGSIPSPRTDHAAVLVDDVMYVFGGLDSDDAKLGDLTALNLSTQRWTAFQDIGPSPCRRSSHAMASDGRRVFVLGGELSRGAQADEAKLIHVLDTNLIYPKPDAPSGKEIAELEDGRVIKLEQQLSETLVAKAQLTDELALKNVLLDQAAEEKKRAELELRKLQANLDESLWTRDHALEQAKASATEERRRAGLQLRELQAKLDESLLSRDHTLEQAEANAAEERRRAGLELHRLQVKLNALNELLLSRDHALEQAEAKATEERRRARLELREMQAKLDELLLSRDYSLKQVEANAVQEKKRSGLEPRELQAKLEESLQSRDHTSEQSQRELAEMRTELEASKSESAAFRLRLADMENGCGESKAEPETYRTQTVTGLVNPDEDRVMHRLMERVQAMEAEMASLRGNEKSFERMECRNEG